ncbi:MAG: response regulator [Bdellovibrionales bacterium]|nr:response regulator [Bdellovibrionales bacterium]
MTPTLMIVSPNQRLRKRIRKLLADAGLLLTKDAGSQQAMLEVVKTDQPNLVILDLFMGKGLSALDLLKILEKTKLDASVILLTPVTTRTLVERAFRSGAKDVLQLPATDEELLSCVLHRKRNLETMTF